MMCRILNTNTIKESVLPSNTVTESVLSSLGFRRKINAFPEGVFAFYFWALLTLFTNGTVAIDVSLIGLYGNQCFC